MQLGVAKEFHCYVCLQTKSVNKEMYLLYLLAPKQVVLK